MARDDAGSPAATRGFAAAAIALAGLLFSFTPLAERIDNAILDAQWSILRKLDPRPSPEAIIIAGIDEASARAMGDWPLLWHEPLALALERIARAKPRAIGLDMALPDRSFDTLQPGLDRKLAGAIAAARQAAPLVAALSIDARTRAARPIHTPFLALLGEEGLGIDLVARDIDGATRRFALALPTEDGSFPTLVGRLCRVLGHDCSDGLVDFALGEPFQYVPLQQVIAGTDPARLEKLFRDRIVFVGDVQRFGSRSEVPVNVAGWELERGSTPTVVLQAQSLRTAMRGAPTEASRALVMLLAGLAALVFLVPGGASRVVPTGILVGLAAFASGTFALRGGQFVPLAGALATVLLAVAANALARDLESARKRAALRLAFEGRVGARTLQRLCGAKGTLPSAPVKREIAFVALRIDAAALEALPPEERVAAYGRIRAAWRAAVHRRDGMIDGEASSISGALFGAVEVHDHPEAAAWGAMEELREALSAAGPAARGAVTLGAASTSAIVAGQRGSGRPGLAVMGEGAALSADLAREARHRGHFAVVNERFARALGDSAPLQPVELSDIPLFFCAAR